MPAKEIHVLHVVPGLLPGGMELAMARLIRSLPSPDIRHSIVCLKGIPVIADQFPESISVHCLHARPNELQLPWRLWRLIHEIRPTVIHARNWGAWPDVAVARLFDLSPVPLIFSFHGLAAAERPPLRRRLAFRVLSRLTTYPMTVCEAAKLMLVNEFGWPARRVRVIPNGVDTCRFSPRSDEKPRSDRLIIGTAGSLTPVKDHAVLIQAFAAVRKEMVNCELWIAGEGPERSRIERIARDLGVASQVRLLGHVVEVSQFLRDLDLFVLPSKSEAHPNALLEAMASGLPCVATRVGGVVEVLDSGRCGLLVSAQDPEALAKALRDLCSLPMARATLGIAARQRAEHYYSLDFMVKQYADLYREASMHYRRYARA